MKQAKLLTPTNITVQTQDGRLEIVCHDGGEVTIIAVPMSDFDSLIKGLQSCKRVLEEV